MAQLAARRDRATPHRLTAVATAPGGGAGGTRGAFARGGGTPGRTVDRLVSVDLLDGFRDVVAELGGRPAMLLADCGLDPSALAPPGSKISMAAAGHLLEHAAERLGCPDLGLRLAERQDALRIIRPLDRLISKAPTLEETLRCCVAHMPAYNAGVRISLRPDTSRSLHYLRLEILEEPAQPFPQLVEQLVLLSHNGALTLSRRAAVPREIWFSHPLIANRLAYRQRFSSTVLFGQDHNQLFFAEADIKAPIAGNDEQLFSLEARSIAARFPPGAIDAEADVRDAIMRTLDEGNCSRERVAASLGIRTRTLNRRLNKDGKNFEIVRDDVRRDLSLRYLMRGDLSLTEIAARLGYSELAVLSRACRRWFRSTPTELRRFYNRAGTPESRRRGSG